jgi:hypothetical protein
MDLETLVPEIWERRFEIGDWIGDSRMRFSHKDFSAPREEDGGAYAGDAESAVQEFAMSWAEIWSKWWGWFLVGGVVTGFLILAGVALGTAALIIVEDSNTDTMTFCTQSANVVEAVWTNDPAVDLGHAARISIQRTKNFVTVKVQMLLNGTTWTSNFPGPSSLGINFQCIPNIKGAVYTTPFIDCPTGNPLFDDTDTDSVQAWRQFDQSFLASGGLGLTYMNGAGAVACLGSEFGQSLYVAAYTDFDNILNTIGSDPFSTFLFSWNAELSYYTDSSDDWSPPHFCRHSLPNCAVV